MGAPQDLARLGAAKRIVFVYTMAVAGRRISASLSSVGSFPAVGGTRLVFTEQGQYFDGIDQPKQREAGCIALQFLEDGLRDEDVEVGRQLKRRTEALDEGDGASQWPAEGVSRSSFPASPTRRATAAGPGAAGAPGHAQWAAPARRRPVTQTLSIPPAQRRRTNGANHRPRFGTTPRTSARRRRPPARGAALGGLPSAALQG